MLLSSPKPKSEYGTWTPKTSNRTKILGFYKRFICTFYPVFIIILVFYTLSNFQPHLTPPLYSGRFGGTASRESEMVSAAYDLNKSKSSSKTRHNVLWQDIEHAEDTRALGGTAGYTVFKNLYFSNGTFFAVTSDESSIPPVSTFLSQSSNGPATEEFFQTITPRTARGLLGNRVFRFNGDSIFFADAAPDSYLAHYYHFVIELFSGAWRTLVSVSDKPLEKMETPQRIILARDAQWRDNPGLNAWFLNIVLPDTTVIDEHMWSDKAKSGQTYMFDRVVILDRWAAHRHTSGANQWNKMNAEVYDLEAPATWWEPLRRSLMNSLQISDDHVPRKPIITYISRQGNERRALNPASHDDLVTALMEIQSEGLADVYDSRMETMTKHEQFALACKTNILIGVHGNGLSHLMWMPRGSEVIEIFAPQAFTRDYEIITPALGHNHYAIWNDTVETEESWRARGHPHIPEDFQGNMIPLNGPFIKDLIKRIIVDKYPKGWSSAE